MKYITNYITEKLKLRANDIVKQELTDKEKNEIRLDEVIPFELEIQYISRTETVVVDHYKTFNNTYYNFYDESNNLLCQVNGSEIQDLLNGPHCEAYVQDYGTVRLKYIKTIK